MHRIDTEGAAGVFSDGNPQTGQLGTLLDAAYYQDLQENVCYAIEQAGIALAKGDATQLRTAIVAIATGVAGGGAGPGSVPTDRVVAGGGLITGGGALNADLTLSLARALAADVLAGTSAAKVPTALDLAGAFGAGAGESITFPGGRIVKQGEVRGLLYPGVATIAFAASFPTACTGVRLTAVNGTGSDRRDSWLQLVSRSKDSFTYCLQTSATGGDTTLDGLDWEASGY